MRKTSLREKMKGNEKRHHHKSKKENKKELITRKTDSRNKK
jgi:hypothetical protein